MYRLPDLTMIQSDLLLEFENLTALVTPVSQSHRQLQKNTGTVLQNLLTVWVSLKESSKNFLQYMKVKSQIFQINVSL